MRGECGAVMLTLALLTRPAFAASDKTPPAASGFQAGVRAGYSRPIGSFQVWRDLEISRTFREQIPITLDVGYRPFPGLYLGGFTSIATGGAGDRFEDLCATHDCDLLGLRFGAVLLGYFKSDSRFDPWLGFGMGGDVSYLEVGETNGDATFTVRGFDFAILSGGTDVRISKTMGIGPYLQYAFGVYTHRRVSTARYTVDDPIGDTEVHGWLTAGIRVVLFP